MILKNGKRIDGCSDTLPIGTVQPFLGLNPPKGYLVCQGQLVSKTIYPELYEICGDSFGTSTSTHFYLPDLRGKTITGYKEGDKLFGTLGGLLGSTTHTHSTGNHTLTINEMPSHSHNAKNFIINSEDPTTIYFNPSGSSVFQSGNDNSRVGSTGGSQAHNHGDTGSAWSLQPSMNLNWIVKAAMLIPDYFIVENTLDSDSTSNALSAAQGKVLSEKFMPTSARFSFVDNDYYTPVGGYDQIATVSGICFVTIYLECAEYASSDIYVADVPRPWQTDWRHWSFYPLNQTEGSQIVLYIDGEGKMYIRAGTAEKRYMINICYPINPEG